MRFLTFAVLMIFIIASKHSTYAAHPEFDTSDEKLCAFAIEAEIACRAQIVHFQDELEFLQSGDNPIGSATDECIRNLQDKVQLYTRQIRLLSTSKNPYKLLPRSTPKEIVAVFRLIPFYLHLQTEIVEILDYYNLKEYMAWNGRIEGNVPAITAIMLPPELFLADTQDDPSLASLRDKYRVRAEVIVQKAFHLQEYVRFFFNNPSEDTFADGPQGFQNLLREALSLIEENGRNPIVENVYLDPQNIRSAIAGIEMFKNSLAMINSYYPELLRVLCGATKPDYRKLLYPDAFYGAQENERKRQRLINFVYCLHFPPLKRYGSAYEAAQKIKPGANPYYKKIQGYEGDIRRFGLKDALDNVLNPGHTMFCDFLWLREKIETKKADAAAALHTPKSTKKKKKKHKKKTLPKEATQKEEAGAGAGAETQTDIGSESEKEEGELDNESKVEEPHSEDEILVPLPREAIEIVENDYSVPKDTEPAVAASLPEWVSSLKKPRNLGSLNRIFTHEKKMAWDEFIRLFERFPGAIKTPKSGSHVRFEYEAKGKRHMLGQYYPHGHRKDHHGKIIGPASIREAHKMFLRILELEEINPEILGL